MDNVHYYSDLALKIGSTINTIWGIQISAMTAAVGWGIASRQWSRPLSTPVAIAAGLMIFGFALAGILSLERLYERANKAMAVALALWPANVQKPPEVTTLYRPWDFAHLKPVALVIDAIVALFVTVLLSTIGRGRGEPSRKPARKRGAPSRSSP